MNITFVQYGPILFDKWTKKLYPYFPKETNISVIYLSKIHNSETILCDDIDSYDVSYYSYQEISKTLDKIKPDVAIFYSFRSPFEVTLQKICKKKHIKQVYLEHGFISSDVTRLSSIKKNTLQLLKRQLYFSKLAIECITRSNTPIKEIQSYYHFYLKNIFKDTPFDHYFLFGERSYDQLKSLFNIDKKDITIVGYPIFNDEKQKENIDTNISTNEGVLYVHQPLIQDNRSTISYEEEKQFLLHIAEKVAEKYGKLSILLHPRSNLDEYKNRFSDTNIEIYQSPNNYLIFANKKLIIGHYSTALLYGLYFNKKTIVIDYPLMQNDPMFNNIFQYISTIDDLDNVDFSNDINKTIYLAGNINTYEHISNCIVNYLSD